MKLGKWTSWTVLIVFAIIVIIAFYIVLLNWIAGLG